MRTTKVAWVPVSIAGSTRLWVPLSEAAELLGTPETVIWASFRDSCGSGEFDQFAFYSEGVWHMMNVDASKELDRTIIFNMESIMLPESWLSQALEQLRAHRPLPRGNAKSQHLAALETHKVTTMAGFRLRGCPLGDCPFHNHHRIGMSEYAKSSLAVNPRIASAEEEFFNGLSFDLACTWEARFVAAFQPQANQQEIWRQLALFMLTDATIGARIHVKTPEQARLIDEAIALAERDAPPEQWEALSDALFKAYQSYYSEDQISDELGRLDSDYFSLYSTYNIASVFSDGMNFPHCVGEAIRSLAQASQRKIVDNLVHPDEDTVKKMADKFIEIIMVASSC